MPTTDELLAALRAAHDAGDVVEAFAVSQRLAAALKDDAREMVPAPRNRDGIGDAEIRRGVDPIFEQLHDALEGAYYQFWRRGLSQPWQGYDVQPTVAESKALFDALHGLIFQHREIALDAADLARPIETRIPDRRRLEPDGRTKADAAADRIATAAARGYTIAIPKA